VTTPESWGRFPTVRVSNVINVHSPSDIPRHHSHIAFGLGRSYGDVALDASANVLCMRFHQRIRDFDINKGILTVEAGAELGDLYEIVLQHGWFFPVVPGTRHVTIGGAIANDIHGKNHREFGSFGCWVRQLVLLHRDEIVVCVPGDELFAATIGGLGLTGIILEATIDLVRVPGPYVLVRRWKTSGFEGLLRCLHDVDETYPFSVAWLDTLNESMRGIVQGGRWETSEDTYVPKRKRITVPSRWRVSLVRTTLVRMFNASWYHMQARGLGQEHRIHLDDFFHPLDGIDGWNKLYGSGGPIQYQCVVPFGSEKVLFEMLRETQSRKMPSLLTVLKHFGPRQSEGLLSFPMPGTTLTLDFPCLGEPLFRMLEQFDASVLSVGGRIYPAKDSRMSATTFRFMQSQLDRFLSMRDTQCQSAFARRVGI
jgi:FAD/FMN-containing dehydrogenase